MSAQILDGKAVALAVRERVAEGVRELIASGGPQPGLATVLVGEDPASQVYVRNKSKACEEAGMASFHEPMPATSTQAEVLARWSTRSTPTTAVDGILVQAPLPERSRLQAGASSASTRPRTSTASIP